MRRAKEFGFSDRQLSRLWNLSIDEVRAKRLGHGIVPTYRLVDTCAAEFEAYTPYYYSSYGGEDEVRDTDKEQGIVMNHNPNRAEAARRVR